VSERDESERDALPEDLRRLYARLQPPPLADDIAEADPETARAVRWMQAAWQELEIPAARVPNLARRAPRRLRRLHFALAAAAGLLLAAGAALWRGLAGAPPEPAARLAEGPALPAADRVEVLAALPDRVELRSGPVRLVLLTPPIPEPFDDPSGS
jgi:hypothetical protein